MIKHKLNSSTNSTVQSTKFMLWNGAKVIQLLPMKIDLTILQRLILLTGFRRQAKIAEEDNIKFSFWNSTSTCLT